MCPASRAWLRPLQIVAHRIFRQPCEHRVVRIVGDFFDQRGYAVTVMPGEPLKSRFGLEADEGLKPDLLTILAEVPLPISPLLLRAAECHVAFPLVRL